MKATHMAQAKCAICEPSESVARTLRKHGIALSPLAVYQVGDYRYTRLADAVAQARRQAAAQAYFAN